MDRSRRNLLTSLLAAYNGGAGSPTGRVAAYLLEHFGSLSQISSRDVMAAADVTRPELRSAVTTLGLADVARCGGEWQLFRDFFLGYVASGGDAGRLRSEIDRLYDSVDAALGTPVTASLVSSLHDARSVVVLTADSSAAALAEFQRAMVMEGRLVRLVCESDPKEALLASLGPADLLVAVSTSGGSVKRCLDLLEGCGAWKVLVSACDDELVQTPFDDALLIGHAMAEGEPLHRVFATYGVAYLFDRLFAEYAREWDPERGQAAAE
ncbi:hypothetical protein [Caniella muris]|uniref:hypothetical protein n=1 Tax=Caniella muris TaxID=2941502 RepID=UPI00203E5EB0|nr:hypothetical protein [Caniella muris]